MEISELDIRKEEKIVMEEYDWKTIRKKFGEWITDDVWIDCGYFDDFDTMDKLWYAYLMLTNHFIIWDGDKETWRRRIVMW